MMGILGRKIGMSQIFNDAGRRVPVTLIEAPPSEVLAVHTKAKHGYDAIQVGIGDKKRTSKNSPKKIYIREFRTDGEAPYKVGDRIDVSIFNAGDFVDVSGVSKGKGFQGGVKRWGWAGGEASHGAMFRRRVGSIGASSYPSRVHKGKTMPGHMGNEKVTTQNLEIVQTDASKALLVVKGTVPGHTNTYLMIHGAVKRPRTTEKKNEKKK